MLLHTVYTVTTPAERVLELVLPFTISLAMARAWTRNH